MKSITHWVIFVIMFNVATAMIVAGGIDGQSFYSNPENYGLDRVQSVILREQQDVDTVRNKGYMIPDTENFQDNPNINVMEQGEHVNTKVNRDLFLPAVSVYLDDNANPFMRTLAISWIALWWIVNTFSIIMVIIFFYQKRGSPV